MKLSDKQIEEFQTLTKNVVGANIDKESAEAIAGALLLLVRETYKPIKQYEINQKEI